MRAGGYERNAVEWAAQVNVGTRAWGILAVGSPRALNGTNAGRVGQFAEGDDSADQLRSKLLLAGLSGLGRIDAGDAASAADSLGIDLGRQIGREHVRTPVTNAQLVCRLLLEKKKNRSSDCKDNTTEHKHNIKRK